MKDDNVLIIKKKFDFFVTVTFVTLRHVHAHMLRNTLRAAVSRTQLTSIFAPILRDDPSDAAVVSHKVGVFFFC